VYGRGIQAKSVQCPYLPTVRVVHQAGTSHLVSLAIEGEDARRNVLIREVQRDPVTDKILHLDFYAIIAGQKLRLEVPLVQHGKSPAEELGGVVMQLLDTIEVECLPEDMPAVIEVDLSRLAVLHARLTVADLPIPENVTVLTPKDAEVVHVASQRMKEEEEVAAPAEVEAEAEAGAEAAPTEEQPAEQKDKGREKERES
jgi:large subunit ribosomal protein L25